MKKDWEYGVLEDAVKKGSSNISLNKVKDDEGEYPLFSAKGFSKKISFFQQEKEYLGIIKDGAGIGRVSKHPAKSSIVATMQYLIPKDGFEIGFIEYFLNGIDFEKHRNGSTIPHIYFKDYKSERFPLLPLPEQKRIVSILDRSFEAIAKSKANAEQNLKNAKELFESYLQKVFENENEQWDEKTLKEISQEFGRGKSKHRPRGDKSILNGKDPLIQTGEISTSNHWINNYTQTYNDKGLSQSKLWPKGTICIAIVGANVAETAILNFDACFPDSVIGIVTDPKKANNEYVEYLLQTFKTYLKEKGKGTARDNINLGTFKNQKFPFPLLKEQKLIVNKLDILSIKIKSLKTIYQNKIYDLEELKKSVLQKAFNGDLTEKEIAV